MKTKHLDKIAELIGYNCEVSYRIVDCINAYEFTASIVNNNRTHSSQYTTRVPIEEFNKDRFKFIEKFSHEAKVEFYVTDISSSIKDLLKGKKDFSFFKFNPVDLMVDTLGWYNSKEHKFAFTPRFIKIIKEFI